MSWDGPQMGDAAFANGLFGTAFQAAGGYLASPNTYHAWSEADWDTVPGPKVPVWEAAGEGHVAGAAEGMSAVHQLATLGVGGGEIMAMAMETRIDVAYAAAFYGVLHSAGYRVWCYGSASTVFGNPSCDGYWVADYAGQGPFMFAHPRVRATQYERGPKFDSSTLLAWTLQFMWTGDPARKIATPEDSVPL